MQSVVIDQLLEPGIRVTVAMGTNRNLDGTDLKYFCISKFWVSHFNLLLFILFALFHLLS